MESTRWSGTDPAEERIRSELRTTLRTYQELGPTYEDQVINSFIDRVQPVLRSRQAVQPQMLARGYARRSGRPHFGLLFLLALLFGWFVFFGGHRLHYYAGAGFPVDRPSIVAPFGPQQPQRIPAQVPQQLPGASVQ